MRIGTGVDVHAYATDDRPLMVACLPWPNQGPGLEGHSDADVVAHALCDAILGAAGLGDLGTNFGTDQPEWAGASGEKLLVESLRRAKEVGWQVANGSVQFVGQRPRLGDARQAASEQLTRICQAPINLAATTTDGLGLTGRSEGAAAIATVLLAPADDHAE